MRSYYDIGERITLEWCQDMYYLGIGCIWNDGKHLTLIDRDKEKAYQDGNPSRQKQNISKKSISEKEVEGNIKSTACLRCGRKLTNKASVARGYGSYCYTQMRQERAKEIAKAKNEEELPGQIFIDELRGNN